MEVPLREYTEEGRAFSDRRGTNQQRRLSREGQKEQEIRSVWG